MSDLICGLFRPIGASRDANAKRVAAQMNAKYRRRLATMFDNSVAEAATLDTPFGAAARRELKRRGIAS